MWRRKFVSSCILYMVSHKILNKCHAKAPSSFLWIEYFLNRPTVKAYCISKNSLRHPLDSTKFITLLTRVSSGCQVHDKKLKRFLSCSRCVHSESNFFFIRHFLHRGCLIWQHKVASLSYEYIHSVHIFSQMAMLITFLILSLGSLRAVDRDYYYLLLLFHYWHYSETSIAQISRWLLTLWVIK